MTFPRRQRIVIGLILIALAIGIGVYRTTTATQIVSAPPLQETPTNDFSVGFGAEVEERMVSVDLRIPAVIGMTGIGLVASAFIRRKN